LTDVEAQDKEAQDIPENEKPQGEVSESAPVISSGAPPVRKEQPVHPLVRFAVDRRVTMMMILVGLVVLGALALGRLPLEFLPPISSSRVRVSVPFPSSSPDEVSRLIVQPLEDSFGTLNNLDRLTSTASAESGDLSLEFIDGTDMDLATVEVRDRIDRVRHLLPSSIRQIQIRRFQSTDIPVLRFQVSAPWKPDVLFDYAERTLQPRLERLDGVAQVNVSGLRQRQVQVELDAARMAAHGIEVRSVASAIRQNHLNLSAGYIRDGSRKFLVRTLGELSTLEDLRHLALNGDGIELQDVASVRFTFPEQDSFNFLNGAESLTVAIYKTSNGNLLDVVDRVNGELALLRQEPKADGASMRVFHDSSLDVRKGLSQLRDAGFIGGGLAILAVFFFLRRWRTTALVGIAIPVSVVFTFVLMFLLRESGVTPELTLNVVSLMGLVLALGMLVDPSIVVIESIYRRAELLKEDSFTAARRGASEVALPITASTATTLCVFLPVIFMRSGGGFFQRYYQEIGITACIVLVASTLVALTIVPMAAARLLKRERAETLKFFDKLATGYTWLLKATLRHRAVFLLLAAGLFALTIWMLGSIQRSFSSRTQERQVSIQVDTPRSYTLEQTDALFTEIYELLSANKSEMDLADISYRYRLGGGRSRGFNRQRRFDVFLLPEEESKLSTTDVRDRIRALLPTRAGVDLRIEQSSGRHGSSGLEVEVTGQDPKVLEILGREIADKIALSPAVNDVDLSIESGDDEVQIRVQRERAVQAGVSSQDVGLTVQSALTDRALSYLKTEDREVDLILRYRDEDRESLNQLQNVPMGAGLGRPLDSLAELSVAPGPKSIDRENRLAKITITGNISSPRALFGAMGAARSVLAATDMPPGYSWSFGRWNRMGQDDKKGAIFSLAFAGLLVYLLMAALFESFSHPLSIMLSVPFAFIGVGLVLKLANQPWDNFTDLGLILLIGVVVNNAIVLVDHINRLRAEGMERDEAILQVAAIAYDPF